MIKDHKMNGEREREGEHISLVTLASLGYVTYATHLLNLISFLVHIVSGIFDHTHLMARPYMHLDDKIVPKHVDTAEDAIKVLFSSHVVVGAVTVLQLLV